MAKKKKIKIRRPFLGFENKAKDEIIIDEEKIKQTFPDIQQRLEYVNALINKF